MQAKCIATFSAAVGETLYPMGRATDMDLTVVTPVGPTETWKAAGRPTY
jgi:hypothetical protein